MKERREGWKKERMEGKQGPTASAFSSMSLRSRDQPVGTALRKVNGKSVSYCEEDKLGALKEGTATEQDTVYIDTLGISYLESPQGFQYSHPNIVSKDAVQSHVKLIDENGMTTTRATLEKNVSRKDSASCGEEVASASKANSSCTPLMKRAKKESSDSPIWGWPSAPEEMSHSKRRCSFTSGQDRVRQPKFTEDELTVLADEVVRYAARLFGSQMASTPPSKRTKLWNWVTQKVNAVASTPRTVSDIKKRWQYLKARVRGILTAHHQAVQTMGSDKVPDPELTPWEETAASVIDGSMGEEVGEVELSLKQEHGQTHCREVLGRAAKDLSRGGESTSSQHLFNTIVGRSKPSTGIISKAMKGAPCTLPNDVSDRLAATRPPGQYGAKSKGTSNLSAPVSTVSTVSVPECSLLTLSPPTVSPSSTDGYVCSSAPATQQSEDHAFEVLQQLGPPCSWLTSRNVDANGQLWEPNVENELLPTTAPQRGLSLPIPPGLQDDNCHEHSFQQLSNRLSALEGNQALSNQLVQQQTRAMESFTTTLQALLQRMPTRKDIDAAAARDQQIADTLQGVLERLPSKEDIATAAARDQHIVESLQGVTEQLPTREDLTASVAQHSRLAIAVEDMVQHLSSMEDRLCTFANTTTHNARGLREATTGATKSVNRLVGANLTLTRQLRNTADLHQRTMEAVAAVLEQQEHTSSNVVLHNLHESNAPTIPSSLPSSNYQAISLPDSWCTSHARGPHLSSSSHMTHDIN